MTTRKSALTLRSTPCWRLRTRFSARFLPLWADCLNSCRSFVLRDWVGLRSDCLWPSFCCLDCRLSLKRFANNPQRQCYPQQEQWESNHNHSIEYGRDDVRNHYRVPFIVGLATRKLGGTEKLRQGLSASKLAIRRDAAPWKTFYQQ